MNNMLKKEILVGVAAAIVTTIFFEPIIRWAWSIIIWVSTRTYSGMVDQIYINAALGQRNYIDVTVFIFIMIAAMLIPIFLVTDFAKSIAVSRLGAALQRIGPNGQKTINFLLIIGTLVFGLLLILIAFTDLQLNTSFEQRLAVLAPILSEQEYKEIKASWAIMDSREDFEAINAKVDELGQQHGIELPKLLLP